MIVSLTLVRYRKALIPVALLAMALHRLPMILQKGCTFWKLLGCGRGGSFSLNPDWQQWGLLAVWESRDDFDQFSKRSSITAWWRLFAFERWTVLLIPMQSHGKWAGKEPFGKPVATNNAGVVAVLTRATIRLTKLKRFWANVDKAAAPLAGAKGFISSFGIGEAPVYRQATFSLWQSIDDVKAYAYESQDHAEVIRRTRLEKWYTEELFARFMPVASFGTINGKDPLTDLI